MNTVTQTRIVESRKECARGDVLEITIDHVTFEDAMEIHRLFQEDFLSSDQIASIIGISHKMVMEVLAGRHFSGAAKHWERKA